MKFDISLGRKNPADSLSRQLVSDALVRKGSVKDANAEYVHSHELVRPRLIKKFKKRYISYLNQFKTLKAQLFQRMKRHALKAQKQDQQ